MNKQTRFIVLALFILVIMLAAAISRFYSGTTQSAGSKKMQAEIESRYDSDNSGSRIFKDSTGLYGLIDSGERITAAPEWLSLKFAENGFCIASKKISGKLMTGCIDYDGNIIIPFIYRSINLHKAENFSFYIAESASDGSCVIYDMNFNSIFSRAWKNASVQNGELHLSSVNGSYVYSVSDNGFILKSAEITGNVLGCSYELDIYSRILLSKLSVSMLEDILSDVGKYLEFAYTGNDDLLSEITTGGRAGFQQLFPDDHKILSKKLLGISEIFIYSLRSDDGVPRYSVSVTADTEIEYSDEKAVKKTLRDGYKAEITFSGKSDTDLMGISGSFVLSEPEYPPEPPTEPVTDESGTIIGYIETKPEANNEDLPKPEKDNVSERGERH